jgi:hypothetical protein
MTTRRIIGAILVVIGLVGLLLGGFSWTEEKTVVDIGPVQARTQQRKTLPIHPVVGGVILAAGVILLLVPAKRST